MSVKLAFIIADTKLIDQGKTFIKRTKTVGAGWVRHACGGGTGPGKQTFFQRPFLMHAVKNPGAEGIPGTGGSLDVTLG